MSILKIAQIAGVSKSTVSRVLNDYETVRPEVVRRVRATMKAQGYTPPLRKRGPKPRAKLPGALKTGTIGVLLLGRTRELLTFPSMARIVSGMVEALGADGLHLTVVEVPDRLSMPPIVTTRGVDGLLVMGQAPSLEVLDRLSPIPCVWQGGVPMDLPIVDHVLPNSRAIGILAADYLIRRGCRRPAFLNHDPYHSAFRLRWNIFSEQLRKAGIEPQRFEAEMTQAGGDGNGYHAEADTWSAARLRQGLAEQVDRMLAAPERPDGLFIPTDQQAAMVWSLLRDRGVIPGFAGELRRGTPGKDLITISVNNDAVWLDSMHPRPATIDPGCEEMGREGVRRLLARIERPQEDPVTVMVTPRLVEGNKEVIGDR